MKHYFKLYLLVLIVSIVFGKSTPVGSLPGDNYIQIDDMQFWIEETPEGQSSANSGFSGKKWTNGKVYYFFDSEVIPANKQRWLEAASEWAEVSDLHFIPKTVQENYIHVANSPNSSWSAVGMNPGWARPTMGISSWTPRVLVHEIGHALGLMHEQSRADRDDYVIIHFENIDDGKEHNFQIMPGQLYGEYDFYSIMHYPKKAFSINGENTIEPLPQYSDMLDIMGQEQLSELDKLGMGRRYPNLIINNSSIEPYHTSTSPPTIPELVIISADISDNDGIYSVSLIVDGTVVGSMLEISEGTYSIQWDTTSWTGERTVEIRAFDNKGNMNNKIYEVVVGERPFDYHFETTRLRYGGGEQELTGWWTGKVWPPEGKTLTRVSIALPNTTIIGGSVQWLSPGEPACFDQSDVFGGGQTALLDIRNKFTKGTYTIDISCSDGNSYRYQFLQLSGSYPDWPEIRNPLDGETVTEIPTSFTWTGTNMNWIEITNQWRNEDIVPAHNTPRSVIEVDMETLGFKRENCLFIVNRNVQEPTYLGSVTLSRFDVDAPADFNEDEKVDFLDFSVIGQWWMADQCDLSAWCGGADTDHSGKVDSGDLLHFLKHWVDDQTDYSIFIPVQGWTFVMGDNIGDGNDDEKPVHLVTLSGFEMSMYEVTNGQYCEYLNAAFKAELIRVDDNVVYKFDDNGHVEPYFETRSADPDSQIDFSDGVFKIQGKGGKIMIGYPVVEVSWYGAKGYCDYYGFTLPSESQWEYAARGGLVGQRFGWGNTISHSQANYLSSDSYPYDVSETRGHHPEWDDGVTPYICPVGGFEANDYGLHDMSGNVGEWCNDWYDNYSSRMTTNPTGPDTGIYRVVRGGGWDDEAVGCRVGARNKFTPDYTGGDLGFRVCR